MALIVCPEPACGQHVSDQAAACPHCGHPLSPEPRGNARPCGDSAHGVVDSQYGQEVSFYSDEKGVRITNPRAIEGGAMAIASTDQAVLARLAFSPRRAAAVIAFPWLLAVLLAAALPGYVPAFERWPAPWGELPTLTRALMAVGRLGTWPIALAGVGLVAVLAGGGAGWVRAGLPGRRAVVLALAMAAIAACVAILVGTLGQVITAPLVPMR
jgi:hypothetical protein